MEKTDENEDDNDGDEYLCEIDGEGEEYDQPEQTYVM